MSGTVTVQFNATGAEKIASQAQQAAAGITKVGTAGTTAQSGLTKYGSAADAAGTKTTGLGGKLKNFGGSLSGLVGAFGGVTGAAWALYNSYDSLEKVQLRASQAAHKEETAKRKLVSMDNQLIDKRRALAEAVEDVAKKEADLAKARATGDPAKIAKAEDALGDARAKVQKLTRDVNNLEGKRKEQLGKVKDAVEKNRIAQEDLTEANAEFVTGLVPMIGILGSSMVPIFDKVSGVFKTTASTATPAAAGIQKVGAAGRLAQFMLGPIGWILIGIGAALTAIATNAFGVRDALNAFGKALGDTFPFLVPLLDVIKGIAGAIGLLGPESEKAAAGLKKAWDTLVKQFTDAFAAIQKGIMDVAGWFSDLAVKIMAGDWEGVWNHLKTGFDAAWSAIKSGAETAAKAIVDFFKIFGVELNQVWEDIKTAIAAYVIVYQNLFKGAVDTINTFWPTIQTAAETVWNAISTVIQTVSAAWPGWVKTATDSINLLWNGIKLAAEAAWGAIDTVIKLLTGGWPTWVSNAATSINATWTVIKTAADLAWRAIDTLIKTFSGGWPAMVKASAALINGVWTTIKTAADLAWNGINNLIKTITQGWPTFVKNAGTQINVQWTAIKNTAKTVWDGINTIVSDAAKAWPGFVKSAEGALKTAFDGIKSAATSAWTAINDAATKVFDGWPAMAQSAKRNLDAAWKGMTDAATAVWKGAKEAFDGFVKALSGLQIPQALKDFGSWIQTNILDPLGAAGKAIQDFFTGGGGKETKPIQPPPIDPTIFKQQLEELQVLVLTTVIRIGLEFAKVAPLMTQAFNTGTQNAAGVINNLLIHATDKMRAIGATATQISALWTSAFNTATQNAAGVINNLLVHAIDKMRAIGATGTAVAPLWTSAFNTATQNAAGVINQLLSHAINQMKAIGQSSTVVTTTFTSNFNKATQNAAGALNSLKSHSASTMSSIASSAKTATSAVQKLIDTIGSLKPKTVDVIARVSGTEAVRALASAIDRVKSKSVTITYTIRYRTVYGAHGAAFVSTSPMHIGPMKVSEFGQAELISATPLQNAARQNIVTTGPGAMGIQQVATSGTGGVAEARIGNQVIRSGIGSGNNVTTKPGERLLKALQPQVIILKIGEREITRIINQNLFEGSDSLA